MFSKLLMKRCFISRAALKMPTSLSSTRSLTSSALVFSSKNDKSNSFEFNIQQPMQNHDLASTSNAEISNETRNAYEMRANDTLESLTEKFDSLAELLSDKLSNDYDVTFSNGVLTVKLGHEYGTYVMNKQAPNLQIWLSSPVSGPKRYDFSNGEWVYKRTGQSLHELLTEEISNFYNTKIDFTHCSYGGSKNL